VAGPSSAAVKAERGGRGISGSKEPEALVQTQSNSLKLPILRVLYLGSRWVVSNPNLFIISNVLILNSMLNCYACRVYSFDYV